MTRGFPDWRRQADQSFDPFLETVAGTFDTNLDVAAIHVGNAPGLIVTFLPVTRACQISLTFQTTSAGGNTCRQYVADVGAGLSMRRMLAVSGPWLHITATAAAAGATTYSLFVAPVGAPTEAAMLAANRRLVNNQAVSIGAGVTRTDDFADWYDGEAHVWAFSQAADYEVQIEASTFNGGYEIIEQWRDEVAYTPPRRVIIPPMRCRLVSVNHDGVARSFWTAVVPAYH